MTSVYVCAQAPALCVWGALYIHMGALVCRFICPCMYKWRSDSNVECLSQFLPILFVLRGKDLSLELENINLVRLFGHTVLEILLSLPLSA